VSQVGAGSEPDAAAQLHDVPDPSLVAAGVTFAGPTASYTAPTLGDRKAFIRRFPCAPGSSVSSVTLSRPA
jgi:hypothetical protein